MNRNYSKIPKNYLNEFLFQQTKLFKGRVQLAAILFVVTFSVGSAITIIALGEQCGLQLKIAWIFTVFVSSVMFFLSKKVSTFFMSKLSAVAFLVLCLSVIDSYFITIKEVPLNVGMSYIFAFIGFSLMFPWSPSEVIGVMILHFVGYTVFLLNTQMYIYKDTLFNLEVPDYIQSFVTMFVSAIFCYVIAKREREKEITNFILIKEIEDKNKQMQDELKLATRVHNRLIPRSVSTNLADIAVTYLPMSYIGGDYAKFHLIDDDKIIFIISDVTGHGVSAALLVNALNVEFERLAKEKKTPGVLLKNLDEFIISDFAETNMYLTAFCGLLDYNSKKLIYSNYGHPPQYIYRAANSQIEKVSAQTCFLGLQKQGENIYQSEMTFDKNDQVLLFTDGVVEARNVSKEIYGAKKLEDFVKSNQNSQIEVFNSRLVEELCRFTNNKFTDDIFILNIKIK